MGPRQELQTGSRVCAGGAGCALPALRSCCTELCGLALQKLQHGCAHRPAFQLSCLQGAAEPGLRVHPVQQGADGRGRVPVPGTGTPGSAVCCQQQGCVERALTALPLCLHRMAPASSSQIRPLRSSRTSSTSRRWVSAVLCPSPVLCLLSGRLQLSVPLAQGCL